MWIKKKSAFLAGVGPAIYALARNLVAPDKPGGKSYDELITFSHDPLHFRDCSMI